MNKVADKLRAHGFDGIHEYDNDLPRWWLILFYATIVFAPLYTWWYHFGPAEQTFPALERQMAELADWKAAAVAAAPPAADRLSTILALTADTSALAKGKAVYDSKCLACHGPQAQGLVGPNLTDNHWIHGGTISNTLKTIEEGVLDKGMLAWKGIMPADEINAVAAFIYTLRGTNPPNPKDPQGDLFEGPSNL